MKKTLIAALALYAANATAQVPTNLLTADYWKNFDWVNVEKSRIWNLPALVDDSNEDLALYRKKAEIQLEKETYQLSVSKSTKQGLNNRKVSLNLPSPPSAQCAPFSQTYTGKFGGGFEAVDNSTIFDPGLAIYSKTFYKNIGNTLIMISCNKTGKQDEDNGEYTSFAISFQEQRVIKKPIALQCSRKIRFTNDNSVEPLPAFSFIFREDSRTVLGLDRVLIAKTENQSPMEISFKVQNNSLITLYTVNRSNGTLGGTINEEGKVVATLEGSCQLYSENKLF